MTASSLEKSMKRKQVFEGRSTRFLHSEEDVFRVVADWAAKHRYVLSNSDAWFIVFRKGVIWIDRFVSCTYYEGWYRIEAWLTLRIPSPGMYKENILEIDQLGVGEGVKKPARKEVNKLLESLGLEPIGKLKRF
jgi:hypothetical protein